MWTFLTWLWGKAKSVYDWFGNWYPSAVNLLNNFWTWLNDRVTHYYELARGYVLTKLIEAKAYALDIYRLATGYASVIVEGAKSVARDLFETAKSVARDLFEAAKAYARSWVEEAKALAQGWVEAARAWAGGVIVAATATIVNWARAAVDMVPSVKDLIAALSGTTLGRLITIVTTYWGTLSVFLRDPLGTIIAYLKNIFITFLCYSLAYALGTEKAELPPWPIFGTGGDAPPGDGPWPPPPEAGKLGRPVIPLYISGYIFTPGHRAVDFGLVNGQSVFATHDGVVEIVAWQPGGYGNYVTIRGSQWWTLYAHLQAAEVMVGQSVSTGQRVAAGDDTGMSTGPHLHFACKYNGEFVDPVLAIDL